MSTERDGGWVYPQPMIKGPNGDDYGAGDWHPRYGGMSLRDWFAGQALTGLVTSPGIPALAKEEGLEGMAAVTAEAAYMFADAMIVARAALPTPDTTK